MASRIGESFDANVTGVLSQGLRVQVRGSLVVGWLPSDALPDGPYEINDNTQELVGPARRYGVGMPVRVRVERADEVQGSLDFSVAR
jgi:ribonuclease R